MFPKIKSDFSFDSNRIFRHQENQNSQSVTNSTCPTWGSYASNHEKNRWWLHLHHLCPQPPSRPAGPSWNSSCCLVWSYWVDVNYPKTVGLICLVPSQYKKSKFHGSRIVATTRVQFTSSALKVYSQAFYGDSSCKITTNMILGCENDLFISDKRRFFKGACSFEPSIFWTTGYHTNLYGTHGALKPQPNLFAFLFATITIYRSGICAYKDMVLSMF